MLDINVCEKLLIQFSQFKPTGRKPTWMEICSFPQQRFEEICSRILKFFLKPDNPHGLKDLFIRSLEQCLSEKCMAGVVRGLEKSNQKEYVVTRGQNGIYRLFSLPEYENYIKEIESRSDKKQAFFLKRALDPYLINCFMNKDQQFFDADESLCVQCEVVTELQNRIDLLVSSNSWVVCIENKIFANVQNPLYDYENYVEKVFGKSIPEDKRFFVILSLKGQEEKAEKWIYIYYHDLFKRIKENLGNYVDSADKDYLAFLMSWIKTMEYKVNNMEDYPMGDFSEDEYKFFSNEENAKVIEKLINRKQKFDSLHQEKFIGIRDSVKSKLESSFNASINAWYWQDVLAIDFKDKTDTPFIDIHAKNGKCYIEFATRAWLKYMDSHEVSMNYYSEKFGRKRDPHERIVLETCEIQEDVIANLAHDWIKKILDFEL